jgi:multidrug resistance efflux pump
LEVLSQEVTRLEDLLAQRLVDAQTLARIRAQHAAVAQAVQLHPAAIAALQAQLEEAVGQHQSLRQWLEGLGAGTNTGFSAAPPEAERLGLLELRRRRYTLRAGAAGCVSRVLHQPGDVVSAGQPIVRLVVRGSHRVIGFLPETNARDLTLGMEVFITKRRGGGHSIPATVTALGPEILGLPGRISPIPGQTVRGRRVVFTPGTQIDLLPGEAVSVRVVVPWREWLFGRRATESSP